MPERQSGRCGVQLEHIGVRRKNRIILEDITLQVYAGEILALIGLNGAGKTTLLRALLGQIQYEGRVAFWDANGREAARPCIGYVPQSLEIDKGTPLTVAEFFCAGISEMPLCFVRSGRAAQRAKEALRRVHAEGLLHKRIGELSGGELQRVLLAFSLAPMPGLLLLDEPVSAVDHRGAQDFYSLLAEIRDRFRISVILVSHDLRQVSRVADRVVCLDKKIICDGTPGEVLHNKRVREAFGLDEWRSL